MSKNKNIIAIIFFLVILLNFIPCQKVSAEVWADFAVEEPSDYADPDCSSSAHKGYHLKCTTLKKASILDNIDFDNIDLVENFGEDRWLVSGPPHKYAQIKFRADLYVPSSGDYQFWVDKNDGVNTSLSIKGKNYYRRENADPSSGSLACQGKNLDDPDSWKSWQCDAWTNWVNLERGWHNISFEAKIYNYVDETNLTLKWQKAGGIRTVIPKENFDWETYSTSEVVIPAEGEEDKSIGYYTAGTGTYELEDGNNPRIRIKVPDEDPVDKGPGNEDFSDIYNPSYPTDGSYVFWYASKSQANPQITIQNDSISGDNQETIFGTRIVSKNGIPTSGVFAQIPSKLVKFNESSREMNFEFKGLSISENADGIGVILPYIDDYVDPADPSAAVTSSPSSRLTLKFIGFNTYHGTHTPVIFDLEDDVDNSDLKPFFFFPDGETKIKAVKTDPKEQGYRPNYMMSLIGSGSRPELDAFLEKDYPADSERIFPRNLSSLNLGNPDTWYPVYGREGAQFDALSAEGSYLPNLENSYIDSEKKDAVIDTLSASNDDKWIAFQWYSSNFASDNVAGSPESGGISVIGFLGGVKERKLAICTTDNRTIYKKDVVNLQAWFWDNYTASGDLCDDPIGTGAVPVTDASIWSSNDTSVLRLEGGTAGAFEGVNKGLTEAVATYNYNGTELIANTEIQVIELETCTYNRCDENSGYICGSMTKVGTSDCSGEPSNCSDTITPETCAPDRPWKEVAP